MKTFTFSVPSSLSEVTTSLRHVVTKSRSGLARAGKTASDVVTVAEVKLGLGLACLGGKLVGHAATKSLRD